MKQFLCDVIVKTPQISQDEIASLLGICASDVIRKKDVNDVNYNCDTILWLLINITSQTTSIGAWLVSITNALSNRDSEALINRGITLILSCGTMYDTYTGSIQFESEEVAMMAALGASIDLSWYPTKFSNGQ